MIRLKMISASNYFFEMFLASVLFTFYLYNKHPILILIITLHLIFISLKNKKLFLVILFFNFIFYFKYQTDYKHLVTNKPILKTCTIHSIPIYNNEQVKFYCKNKTSTILIYSKDIDTPLKIGYTIMYDTNLEPIKKSTIPNLFDYANFLLSKKIAYQTSTDKIKVIKTHTSLNFQFINRLIHYYEDNQLRDYILSFLVGNKNELNSEFYQNIKTLNISHLFVVSGFHIGFLYVLIKFICKYMKVSDETSDLIVSCILIIFLIINNFSISVLRAVCFLLLLLMKKRFKLPVHSIQVLSFIGIINLFLNPFILYDAGFLLSYFITLALLLSHEVLKWGKIVPKAYKIHLIASLFSLPIIANFNYFYNFLSWILTPILSLYYTFIIFPLTILLIIIPFLDHILYPFYTFYETIVLELSKLTLLNFNIGVFTTMRAVLYYLILIYIMVLIEKRKKIVHPLFVLGFLILFYHSFTLTEEIQFFDVGQGDSIYLRSDLNQCKLLLDTGGSETNFHPGEKVARYLNSTQIHQIDYLFISHSDADHAGDYLSIINTVTVKNIVLSAYDESKRHDEIYELAKKNKINIIDAKAYTKLECGKLMINIINPIQKNNTNNDNSLVLFLIFHNDHYLFLGDVSKETDETIIKNYPMKADFIKIAHHGSKYSTSLSLLEQTNVKYGIISVGKNNYHHPSNETIQLLNDEDIDYFRTDVDGTITVKYFMGLLRMIIRHLPYNINACYPVIKHMLFNVDIDLPKEKDLF